MVTEFLLAISQVHLSFHWVCEVFNGRGKKPVLEDFRRKEKEKPRLGSWNGNDGVRTRSQYRCVSSYESLGPAWILFRLLRLESRYVNDFHFINSFFVCVGGGRVPFCGDRA